MFQVNYIYCVLYFYYYISPTSDHQALYPRGWGPLVYTVSPIPANEISSFFSFCMHIHYLFCHTEEQTEWPFLINNMGTNGC